uniref:Uncharacterized protein n=1 Tax=Zea mays TaxID=4577 RepID=B8A1A2_MAIZE|nr:unknown [Zea mays]
MAAWFHFHHGVH